MSVICPICQYDNPEEDVLTCSECGFDFLQQDQARYTEPLRQLRETSESLATSFGSFSQEKLESVYSRIVSQLNDIVSQNREDFKKKVSEIREVRKVVGATDEELPFDEFVVCFDEAQARIDESLSIILQALNSMRTLKDPQHFKQGQMQVELAISYIEQSFVLMQNCSIALVDMPDEFPPIDIVTPSEMIEDAISCINTYLEDYKVGNLRDAVRYLTEARDSLSELIAGYYAETGDDGSSDDEVLDNELQTGEPSDDELENDEECYEDEQGEKDRYDSATEASGPSDEDILSIDKFD